MNYSIVIEKDDFLFLEITGTYSRLEGERIIEEIYNICTEKNIKNLLFDITKKEGSIPNIDRFIFGELISKMFSFKVKVAVIGKKDQINKFSETVAFNRGGLLSIFPTKDEALEWLIL